MEIENAPQLRLVILEFVRMHPHCDIMEIVMSPDLVATKTWIVVELTYALVQLNLLVEDRAGKIAPDTHASIATFSVA